MEIYSRKELAAMAKVQLLTIQEECNTIIEKFKPYFSDAEDWEFFYKLCATYDEKMNAAKTEEECHAIYINYVWRLQVQANDALDHYLLTINFLDVAKLLKQLER